MRAHGAGRLRHALESLGYDVRKIVPATSTSIPADCAVVVDVNPRTTYLPGESDQLVAYLAQGGSALLLFVKFTPAGVMPQDPRDIDRVEITAGTRRWSFARSPAGWRGAGGEAAPAALAAHLDDAIKFLHVSAPVRVMERAEWSAAGLREFGLDPPGYSATLSRGDGTVLAAEFGAPNPQQVLQYMKLGGRDQVYLMSRFVGEEWEKAIGAAAGR